MLHPIQGCSGSDATRLISFIFTVLGITKYNFTKKLVFFSLYFQIHLVFFWYLSCYFQYGITIIYGRELKQSKSRHIMWTLFFSDRNFNHLGFFNQLIIQISINVPCHKYLYISSISVRSRSYLNYKHKNFFQNDRLRVTDLKTVCVHWISYKKY